MPTIYKIILITALHMAGFSTASAQSNSSANHTITLILQNSFNSIIGFGLDTSEASVDAVDFQNNLANTAFQVKSKQAWAITVSPIAANFTGAVLDSEPGYENNSTIYRMSVVYTASQE